MKIQITILLLPAILLLGSCGNLSKNSPVTDRNHESAKEVLATKDGVDGQSRGTIHLTHIAAYGL